MTITARLLGSAALATLLIATPALAADLSIGVASETTSIDPHYQDLGPNNEIRGHIFDGLTERGPNQEILPALAESWAPTADPSVWEFKLRKGVVFHDGSPFTAADVVFSITRAPNVPGAPSTFARLLREVEGAEAVDDHTVRIRTKGPFALLPNNLTSIGIVSARIGKDATPVSFNEGKSAIGTGPYRYVSFAPGDRVELAAFPGHWGRKPQWDKVTFRKLTNAGSRVATLLTGEIDVIAAVPTASIERLRSEPKVTLAQGVSNRIIFWSIDVARESSPHVTAKDGSPIKNPLRDLRVRQAMEAAVDRAAIVERIMEGVAVPATQIVPEGFGGHSPNLPVPKPDLAKARRLMTEAGYANGFKLTIHTTNDRYVNDAKLAQTIAQFWSRIGIEVTVAALPVAVYFNQARNGEFSVAQVGWGNITGESSVVLTSSLHSRSRDNYGKWTSAAFDKLLDDATKQLDEPKRNAMLVEAVDMAMADVALVPTHFQVNVWGLRKGLKLTPRADELTLATSVAPE